MAHKKSGGSTSNGRDSNPKYRGVKKFGGEAVETGMIIIRQKGTKVHIGKNVRIGRDFTIYAMCPGKVKFAWFTKNQKIVSVIPA